MQTSPRRYMVAHCLMCADPMSVNKLARPRRDGLDRKRCQRAHQSWWAIFPHAQIRQLRFPSDAPCASEGIPLQEDQGIKITDEFEKNVFD